MITRLSVFTGLFGIIADGRIQNLDVIDYFTVNSCFAKVLQLDGIADRIGAAAMGEPAEPKVILRSPLSSSQVMPSVVLPFSMLSRSESSTYSAVTPVGRVMLSASVSGPALFVLDHKRNSVIQVGIACHRSADPSRSG